MWCGFEISGIEACTDEEIAIDLGGGALIGFLYLLLFSLRVFLVVALFVSVVLKPRFDFDIAAGEDFTKEQRKHDAVLGGSVNFSLVRKDAWRGSRILANREETALLEAAFHLDELWLTLDVLEIQREVRFESKRFASDADDLDVVEGIDEFAELVGVDFLGRCIDTTKFPLG